MTAAKIERVYDTDVLVVGAGAAASRTALAAVQTGARTIVAVKKRLGRSGATNYPRKGPYGSAWQAADGCSGPDDSPEVHYQDIMSAALGMADARMAWTLAHEAPERLLELEQWGFKLIADPESKQRHYSGYSCFASQPRAHGMAADPVGGHTGNMVATLAGKFTDQGVEVHEDTAVIDLLVEDGACVGALAVDPGGDLVAYRAGAVVLATGGAGQMFPLTLTPGEITGDGYAMALRAGAELANMEFMQYMVRPVSGQPPSMAGPFWSLNPVVRDSTGVDTLRDALPPGVTAEQVFLERTLHYPFSSRDDSKWLDIAMQRAIQSGRGTARSAILVDFSDVDPSSAREARPQHRPTSAQVELGDSVVEVTHAAHAINGGIRVDEWGQSAVPGLFAVGETIAGPHGADRLGGGMLSACNVFGARAGMRAAEYTCGVGKAAISSELLAAPLARLDRFRGTATSWFETRKVLKQLAASTLIVLRCPDRLASMLEEVRRLRHDLHDRMSVLVPESRVHVLDTENLLLTAEVMVRAALMRTESRGSHFREDYPERDDRRWLASIFWRMEGEEPAPTIGRYRQHHRSAVQVERLAAEPTAAVTARDQARSGP
jgi:fumarate reductase (CoM/CoB) subunit A